MHNKELQMHGLGELCFDQSAPAMPSLPHRVLTGPTPPHLLRVFFLYFLFSKVSVFFIFFFFYFYFYFIVHNLIFRLGFFIFFSAFARQKITGSIDLGWN